MIPAVYRQLQDQKGGALLIVLVMIVIVGLSAGIAGTSWQTIVQRADEAELFWRGNQYRQAIQSYYDYGSGSGRNQTGQYPVKLEALLKDPRSLSPKKHIRQLYLDPITDGDWELIKDKTGRIVGVRSSSDREPFRQDGFPLGYEDFTGASSYSSWEFSYQPTQTPLATGVQTGNKTSGSSEGP